MRERIRLWNQYGFEPDVIDKYRESVTRSNRVSVRVFSILDLTVSLVIMAFGFITGQPKEGAVFCFVSLSAGIYGAYASFRHGRSGKRLLTAAYFLCVSTYALAIYGVYVYKSDAFWIGTVLSASCYVFDYAMRIGVLQVASYAALQAVWLSSGVSIDPVRKIYSALFLLISLVTFYTLNRARAAMIAGQQKSQQQADTDLLTGMAMRAAAQKQIEEHLRTGGQGVLLLLDLDGFKSVNDRLGHQMGDSVLAGVAADLRKMFRNGDVLSRLGGDEFMVYMKNVPERDWALQRAGQVVREVRRWVGNGTTNIQVTASIGIVMTDMVDRAYDDLYRAADIAMYAAKGQGGNRALFYMPEMPEHPGEKAGEAQPLTGEAVREGNAEVTGFQPD